MKALVKLKPMVGLSIQEVKMPAIQEHEALIKIKATAICGTDLHIFNWDHWASKNITLPLIIGHEFMGEVAAVGKKVSHLKIGDRVSGEGHLVCGLCRNCREGKQHLCPKTRGIGLHRAGACAEYLAMPADNIISIPNFITDDIATILDPLGNAVHTTLSFDTIGEDLLITGAGPIGLMAIAVAKHTGAKRIVITDINDYRLNLAKVFGATETLNAEKQPLNTLLEYLSQKFNIGLEMSGNKNAFLLLLEAIRHGGSIALLGIPEQDIILDCNKVIFKGLTLKGIYGRKMYETWDKMLNMLQSGLDVSSVITHHFEAQDFKKAFETIILGKAGKVILHW